MAAGLSGTALFTWYWRAALDAEPRDVTLVRISLGGPRWAGARTAAIPYISEFAPVGGLFHVEDPEAFRRLPACPTGVAGREG